MNAKGSMSSLESGHEMTVRDKNSGASRADSGLLNTFIVLFVISLSRRYGDEGVDGAGWMNTHHTSFW